MGAMRYKPLDKVRIKSLDWYNENKDKKGNVYFEGGEVKPCFSHCMSIYCGQIMTISDAIGQLYDMIEDDGRFCWVDEMIESLVEDIITTNEQLFEPSDISLEKEMEWNLPDGYIFKDENGNVINATKIVLEKKKKEYPKTYETCCKVLDVCSGETLQYGDLTLSNDYEFNLYTLLENFRKLLICRDAYWKIAGEEMGLGKPWKPDWNNISDKYCIYFVSGYAWSKKCQTRQCPFAFPTPEMRDAFYENFKSEIEICKELL